MTAGSAPTLRAERITNLDTVRGIATLGILPMNAVSFGLADAAYFNLRADGSDMGLDWVVAAFGEIFIDQKMMALFSLLFGAGIVLFADRAEAKGRRPFWFSLWRNVLLLGIGLLHGIFFAGDVLQLYAVCAPILLLLRKRSPRTLLVLGGGLVVSAAIAGFAVAPSVTTAGLELGEIWHVGGGELSDTIGLWFLWEFGARALGLMLIGVAAYRLGVLQGTGPIGRERQLAMWGLGVGLPLAVLGFVVAAVGDFAPRSFLPSHAINTLATIPTAVGYLGVISLWNRRPETPLHRRIRAVGRMALTNYLTQTLLGLVLLDVVLGGFDIGRTAVFGGVVLIWLVQVAWSEPWLTRFTMGPCEWLWRALTYRRFSPLRRSATSV